MREDFRNEAPWLFVHCFAILHRYDALFYSLWRLWIRFCLQWWLCELRQQPAHFHAPSDAIQAGIGFCPEDRKMDGIIPYLSVRDNMTLAALPVLARNGIVSRKRQQEIVDQYISRLGIKTAGPDQPIRELSGGNQQKVLLARWLCLNPKLLILDEPTRGIDVGAKAEIQSLIDELADKGLGVLMISSELEELIEGCDSITVMRGKNDTAAGSAGCSDRAGIIRLIPLR